MKTAYSILGKSNLQRFMSLGLVFVLIVLLSASVQAISIEKKVTAKVTEIGINYFKVSGTIRNISTYLEKGFRYRQTQVLNHRLRPQIQPFRSPLAAPAEPAHS